jgi:hypothetical protein
MSIKADNDMAALLDDSPLFLCLLSLVLTLVFIIHVTNVGFVKPRTAIARSDHLNNLTWHACGATCDYFALLSAYLTFPRW